MFIGAILMWTAPCLQCLFWFLSSLSLPPPLPSLLSLFKGIPHCETNKREVIFYNISLRVCSESPRLRNIKSIHHYQDGPSPLIVVSSCSTVRILTLGGKIGLIGIEDIFEVILLITRLDLSGSVDLHDGYDNSHTRGRCIQHFIFRSSQPEAFYLFLRFGAQNKDTDTAILSSIYVPNQLHDWEICLCCVNAGDLLCKLIF